MKPKSGAFITLSLTWHLAVLVFFLVGVLVQNSTAAYALGSGPAAGDSPDRPSAAASWFSL